MKLIDKAIQFAAKAHQDQFRKGTTIPYITHPFAVGMILQKARCSEEVIAAGILHDTLEDTPVTYHELAEEFGNYIANLVQAASEHDKSLSWEERKQHTIEMLKDTTDDELYVIIGDKLHNLRSIHEDLQLHGDSIWDRFNRGKREQHWYYSSIVKAIAPRKNDIKLIRELEKEVKQVFGSLTVLTESEISLLFSCAYLHISDDVRRKLQDRKLDGIADSIMKEADTLYRTNHEVLLKKLRDFHASGIQFEINSEGPLLLAAFCVTMQRKMQWSDEELFSYFQKMPRNFK